MKESLIILGILIAIIFCLVKCEMSMLKHENVYITWDNGNSCYGTFLEAYKERPSAVIKCNDGRKIVNPVNVEYR